MRGVAAVLAAFACVTSASQDRLLVEDVAGNTGAWVRMGHAPDTTRVEVVIAVTQGSVGRAALEAELFAVSDPTSPRYGQHLGKEEVDAMTQADPTAMKEVTMWLESEGIATTPVGDGSYLRSILPVREAEQLLGAKYGVYVHRSNKQQRIIRCERYSLPASVAKHIDFAAPTTRFPVLQTLRRSNPTSSNGQVTPDSIRKLYNVGDVQAKSTTRQSVVSFLGQFINEDDLQMFFTDFYPTRSGDKPDIHGPNQGSQPGIEASLDIQYLMAVGSRASTQIWSTAGEQPHNPENEPFLKWLLDVSNVTDSALPYVFSISYADYENTVYLPYGARVNTEFMKLGARGVSLMAGSGDGGVSGAQPEQCTDFVPTFPAASPYITGVGGTTGENPETAVNFSGGGFSNYWARPSFQDAAIQAYMNSGVTLPPSGLYNHTGAGFPDVAAQSTNFQVVYSGSTIPVDGTSCATPTFSGVVTLLVDARLAAGKGPLGWLNPLIYQGNGQGYNDITSGNNPGCGQEGYYAATGWDPITGFGTPDYEQLESIVLSLP